MKYFATLILAGICTAWLFEARGEQLSAPRSTNSDVVIFSSFQVDTANGWLHSIEKPASGDWGELIIFHHPEGVGTLKVRSLVAPEIVSRDDLRNMTNVDSALQLTFKRWGDYTGFQHDYLEKDSFFRQWWLANESTIIFITYSCGIEFKEIENQQINDIVRSLKINTP